jgi:hypothetical protein
VVLAQVEAAGVVIRWVAGLVRMTRTALLAQALTLRVATGSVVEGNAVQVPPRPVHNPCFVVAPRKPIVVPDP